MRRENTQIRNKLGLHARAAAKLVATASKFESNVMIERDSKKVDGKSIMSLLMLAAGQGTKMVITAEGVDEDAAIEAILQLIDNRFDEGE